VDFSEAAINQGFVDYFFGTEWEAYHGYLGIHYF
jgi:hypothetical protein